MSNNDGPRYAHPYLKETLFKIDFLSPLESVDKRLDQNLSRHFTSMFPVPEPRPLVQQRLRISGSDYSSSRKEQVEWNFFGVDRQKRLTLGASSLILGYRQYPGFVPFRTELFSVLDGLFAAYKGTAARRLGLRYVNEIRMNEPDPLNWTEYLRPEILCLLRVGFEGAAITRAFNVLEMTYPECALRYQFGMHNPDYPAAIRQKVFILDLDAYRTGDKSLEEIRDSVDSFHSRIQSVFEWSITDNLRTVMNA